MKITTQMLKDWASSLFHFLKSFPGDEGKYQSKVHDNLQSGTVVSRKWMRQIIVSDRNIEASQSIEASQNIMAVRSIVVPGTISRK